MKRCLSRIIDLLKMADQEISVFNIRKMLLSAFNQEEVQRYLALQNRLKNPRETKEKKEEALKKLNEMVNSNYCLSCLTKAVRKEKKNEEQQELCQFLQDYFLKTFPKMPEKTRAIVEESIFGLIEPFMSGILKQHFTKGVSPELHPEEAYKKGKIIIVNMPVKEYLIAGVFAQAIYKKLWQEAIERRNVKRDPLPVFMWVDEAQYFLNEQDARFQTTARESLACTVMITQNISNYYAAIGGKHPKENVDSLMGNFGTKIWHANNDYVTNNWASNTIGKTFQSKHSFGSNFGTLNGSANMSQALHFQLEPQEFTILKSGSKEFNFKVEGIITVAGKQWSNQRNFAKVVFDQNYIP
ncbi:MAG: TraM recognition domain-containing protein [Bacteroidota bacterium]